MEANNSNKGDKTPTYIIRIRKTIVCGLDIGITIRNRVHHLKGGNIQRAKQLFIHAWLSIYLFIIYLSQEKLKSQQHSSMMIMAGNE